MAELVEYSLVVMVSALFVMSSAATYVSFASFESQLQLRETFASVTALVNQAMSNGSSRATLTLPDTTIACGRGSLTVTVGSGEEVQSVPVACSFEEEVKAGPHTLSFTERSSSLSIAVF